MRMLICSPRHMVSIIIPLLSLLSSCHSLHLKYHNLLKKKTSEAFKKLKTNDDALASSSSSSSSDTHALRRNLQNTACLILLPLIEGDGVSCICNEDDDLSCTDDCTYCNDDLTICGMESFIIDIDISEYTIDGIFTYTVGRDNTVILRQTGCNPLTFECNSCLVFVDGDLCDSCSLNTCNDGSTEAAAQCGRIEPNSNIDLCEDTGQIPDGSVFALLKFNDTCLASPTISPTPSPSPSPSASPSASPTPAPSTIAAEPGCAFTFSNGTIIQFEVGQSYGDQIVTECGSPEAYPCFCTLDETDLVRCPYCGYETIDGDTVCAVDGGTATFVDPDGANQTCTCEYLGNGFVNNACVIHVDPFPQECVLKEQVEQCEEVSATMDPIEDCDCYNYCAGEYSNCCKFGEPCATGVCNTVGGIVAGCEIPKDRPPGGCYTDLNDILIREAAVTDTSERRTYTLCPDTVFSINSFDDDGNVVSGTMSPIVLRDNVYYRCGFTGSSRNNCVFSGGSSQVVSSPAIFPEEETSNVVLEGITFDAAQDLAVGLLTPGDVTFIDCTIQNFQAGNAVLAFYEPTSSRRLKAKSTNDPAFDVVNLHKMMKSEVIPKLRQIPLKQQTQNRKLQLGEELLVTFQGSLFQNNAAPVEGELFNGVISGFNDFVIEDCIFQNNDYSSALLAGCALFTAGSLSIKDTCFIDNDFTGPGTILITGDNPAITSSNNYGTQDDGLTCNFISASFTDLDDILGFETVGCLFEYDSDSCEAVVPAIEPTAAPSSSPTQSCIIEQNTDLCPPLVAEQSPEDGCDCYNYCGSTYAGCCAEDDFDCTISCNALSVGEVLTAGCRLPKRDDTPKCKGVGITCTNSGDCCSMRCISGSCARPLRPIGNPKLSAKLSGGQGGAGGRVKNFRRKLKTKVRGKIGKVKGARRPL